VLAEAALSLEDAIRSVAGPFWAPGGSEAFADPKPQERDHPPCGVPPRWPAVIESLNELRRLDDVIVGSEKVGPVYEPPFSSGHFRSNLLWLSLDANYEVFALVLVKSPAAGTQATGAGG
jgi:hypothetical protein